MARRRTGFQKKIDVVHWAYGSFEAIALATTGVIGVLVHSAQHLPETMLRNRGEWAASLSGALGDGQGAAVTVGLILVPEGTGTTVLWDPITDGDAPWVWWDVLHLIYREHVTDGNYSSATSSGRRVIDSKAMRKVRNSELQFVVNNADIGALTGSVIDVAGSLRTLAGS